jgi:hypothetical protein
MVTRPPGAKGLRSRDCLGRGRLLGDKEIASPGGSRHSRRLEHPRNIKPMRSLAEPLQVAMDNGARKALIPLENKRNFLEVSGDIVERVDPVFFSDPMTAAIKALGMTWGMLDH